MIKILLIALSTLAYSAEYVIPADFDNFMQEIKSAGTVMITNSSTLFSSKSLKLGEKIVKARCVAIPKISCKNPTSASIKTTISSVSLKEDKSNELVIPYQTAVFTEELATSWKVCAAALGGVTWDKSEITSTKDANGLTTIKHDFKANLYRKLFYFFSKLPTNLVGKNSSYMIINTNQVCR